VSDNITILAETTSSKVLELTKEFLALKDHSEVLKQVSEQVNTDPTSEMITPELFNLLWKMMHRTHDVFSMVDKSRVVVKPLGKMVIKAPTYHLPNLEAEDFFV
jgi:hypothetical protein